MRPLFTYLLVLATGLASAQVRIDTVHTLPEVVKESSSVITYHQSPITSFRFINTKSLNDVMKENAGIYVKNYGTGQLASICIRGTSAAQTDVLWNGIKLNSPALGQVDASLFNLGMSDQLEIGGTSLYGNVGGFVNIKNDNRVDSGFALNASIGYGSFNTLRGYGKANYGNGKFSGTSRIGYLSSDNNYTFVNTYKAGNPTEKLTNGKVQLLSFMQQFNAKINGANALHLNLWLTDAQRQVPPVISKPQSKEAQDDYSLRAALSWNEKFNRFSTAFTTAFLHDVINYRNPEINMAEKSTMQALRNNFSVTVDSLGKFSVTAAVGYDFERALVPSYQTTRNRHIGKLEGIVRYEPTRSFLLMLNLRQQVYGKNLSPFSPTLSARYYKQLLHNHSIVLRASAGRNFRFPTLNDLYWLPGGNPNLKTEKSCDGEVGAQYYYSRYFNVKATGFCKYIDNWIQWVSTGTYWEPRNVKRVLTRGIELSAKMEGPFNFNRNFNFALSVNYTYTRATNLDAVSPADQSKGKQLIYVPLNVANALIHIEYKKFYLRAINTYTDAVYITTDNSQGLKGYYLLDLEVGKDFAIKNYQVGLAFRVNNATGAQYQNVAQRPMPGRNFEGTLRFNLFQ